MKLFQGINCDFLRKTAYKNDNLQHFIAFFLFCLLYLQQQTEFIQI